MAYNKNRKAGHDWERQIVKDLSEIYDFPIWTSRQKDLVADSNGIDIVTENPNEIPFIQAKVNSKKSFTIQEVFDHMKIPPEKDKIILLRQREKRKNRFYTQGEYAIIPYSLYLEFLKK